MPTVDGVIGMANFGPTATVFTLGPRYTVQQYDINPNSIPVMVATAHHVLSDLPPSPPNSVEELQRNRQHAHQRSHDASSHQNPRGGPLSQMPVYLDAASSEDETAGMSPLAKIAQEQPEYHEELRDQVPPLASPVSSKGSISSSNKSSQHRGHTRRRAGSQSKTGTSIYSHATQSESTLFSEKSSVRSRETDSMRSGSSTTSSRHGGSRLRQEILRSPEEAKQGVMLDLFPYTKSRLSDVHFRTPKYDGLSVDDLRIQMLSTVFGWEDDIESLIRDERKSPIQTTICRTKLTLTVCRRSSPERHRELGAALKVARGFGS